MTTPGRGGLDLRWATRLSRWLLRAIVALLFAGIVTGCASSKTKTPETDPGLVTEAEDEAAKLMKAKAAPDSGFLADADQMQEHRDRAPFDRSWADPSFATANYRSILVAPVNTKFVLEETEWEKMNLRNVVASPHADLEDFAAEFRQIVIDAFHKSKKNQFAIVDRSDEQTMIFELAITELVPGKAFLGTVGLASWAAPVAIGVPVGAVASFADVGWTAIEGRVRDARTGKVVARFADREQSKTRVLDLSAMTWYGHARESMHDWADQFVLLANTPNDVEVVDSSWFELKPW
jgi:Protein of unknown function (DUF3313)